MLKLKQLAMAAATAALMVNAHADVVSEGVTTIPGTYIFDLDTGTLPSDHPTYAGGDIWWEQYNSTSRAMNVWGSVAKLAYVGVVGSGGLSFNSLSAADLAGLTYSNTVIPGGDALNKLTPNTIFAVRTDQGNFAKVLVTFPFSSGYQNNGLGIYWVTMAAPVPEPEGYAMLLAGLGLIGAIARRRRGT